MYLNYESTRANNMKAKYKAQSLSIIKLLSQIFLFPSVIRKEILNNFVLSKNGFVSLYVYTLYT